MLGNQNWYLERDGTPNQPNLASYQDMKASSSSEVGLPPPLGVPLMKEKPKGRIGEELKGTEAGERNVRGDMTTSISWDTSVNASFTYSPPVLH